MSYKNYKPMVPIGDCPIHKPSDHLICSLYWFGLDCDNKPESNGHWLTAQCVNWLIRYGQYQHLCGLASINCCPTDTMIWCIRKAAEKYIKDENLDCIDILFKDGGN